MTRSNTVELLNDSDDVGRKLDWILFQQEMDHIWAGDDWKPGIPIYDRPSGGQFCGGQTIRYMIEEIEDRLDHIEVSPNLYQLKLIRCEDCEVSWDGHEPCWICGAECPVPVKQFGRELHELLSSGTDEWTRNIVISTNEMRRYLFQSSPGWRGPIYQLMSEPPVPVEMVRTNGIDIPIEFSADPTYDFPEVSVRQWAAANPQFRRANIWDPTPATEQRRPRRVT